MHAVAGGVVVAEGAAAVAKDEAQGWAGGARGGELGGEARDQRGVGGLAAGLVGDHGAAKLDKRVHRRR